MAVNLYNIARDALITGAPIKGQCARNYFYGRDGVIERALQGPEGAYAAIVAKATADPASLTQADLEGLREFALLQTFRSAAYIDKLIALSNRHQADIEAAAPGSARLPPPMLASHNDAVKAAIRQFLNTMPHVRDLETCLIVNETKLEFITSDDPAIHTNRFHFQKLRRDAFGLGSSGAMLFLPLTPKLAFAAYDGHFYLAPNRRGVIVGIRRDDEVLALNEMQLLHARDNLYFAAPATGALLAAHFGRSASNRPAAWTQIRHFARIDETDGMERYERVEAMSLEQGQTFLTALQFVHIRPSRWPRLLEHRLRPRVVDTGTGGGVLRPGSETLRELL